MFTGLVEGIGRIIRAGSRDGTRDLTIRSPFPREGLPAGSSVSVQGVCLTLVEDAARDGSLRVQAAPETLRRTTLGRLRVGDRVHLERAVQPSGRMGGHVVQGHVDGIGRVRRTGRLKGDWVLEIAVSPTLRRYIVEKGSICVDGVSLTVGATAQRAFRVHIIPKTAEKTLLPAYRAGKEVNIEVDVMAKYAEALLASRHAGLKGGPGRPGSAEEDWWATR